MAKYFNDTIIKVLSDAKNVQNVTGSTEIRESSSPDGDVSFAYAIGNQEARTSSINFGKAGNYDQQYQVIQMSGRTDNNKNLVYNDGNTATVTSSISESSVFKDFAVQDRKIQKTVIVEKFSSPGGFETNAELMLNKESGEFSAYNGINNRNLLVRKNLDSWSSETSSIGDNNIPAIHKINKNAKYNVDFNAQFELVFETAFNDTIEYDNLFIQHNIPQSEKQYLWADSSLQKQHLTEPQYRSTIGNITKVDYFRILDVKRISKTKLLVLSIKSGFYNLSYYKVADSGREKRFSLVYSGNLPFSAITAPSLCILNITGDVIDTEFFNVYGIIGGIKKGALDTFAFLTFKVNGQTGIEASSVYNPVLDNGYLVSYPPSYNLKPSSQYNYAIERVTDDVACAITWDAAVAGGSRARGMFLKYDGNNLSTSSVYFNVFTASITNTDAQYNFTKPKILPVNNSTFVVSVPIFDDSLSIDKQAFVPINFDSNTLVTSSAYNSPPQYPTASYYSADFQYLSKDDSNNTFYSALTTHHFGAGNFSTNTQAGYLKNTLSIIKIDSNLTCSILSQIDVASSSNNTLVTYPYNEQLQLVDSNCFITNKTQDSSIIDFSYTSNETQFKSFYSCNESSSSGVKLIFGNVLLNTNSTGSITLLNKQELLQTSSFWNKIVSISEPNDTDIDDVCTIYEDGQNSFFEHCSIIGDKLYKFFVDRSLFTMTGYSSLWTRQFYKNYSVYSNIDTTLLDENLFFTKRSLIDPSIDFCGTNQNILKDFDENTNTISLNASTEFYSNGDIRSFLVNLNGFFGFPSWKQVRQSQNYYSNKLIRQNKYFIDNVNYYESPISYQKPAKLNILENNVDTITYEIDYINKNTFFSNENITNKLDEKFQSYIYNPDKSDKYVSLKNSIGLKRKFINLDLTEILYPKKNYLSDVRQRENYEEETGTGSDGYDKNTNDINTFWKNTPDSRKKTENYSFNNLNFKNATIVNDNSDYYKKTLLAVNYLTSSTSNLTKSLLGVTSDKVFSFWALDNSFYVPNSQSSYNLIEFQDLFAEKATRNPLYGSNITASIYDLFATSKHILGDLSFPGYLEERKITYFIPDNIFNINSIPRTSFIFNPFSFTDNYEPFGLLYKTNIIAGRNPWYDSYLEYAENLRPIGQFYSILPEYNLSDNVKHYINKGINIINKSFLSMKGQNISSSVKEENIETKNYSSFSSVLHETNKAKDVVSFISSVNNLTSSNKNLKLDSTYNKNYTLKNNVIANPSLDNVSKFELPISLQFNNTGSESHLQIDISKVNENLYPTISSPNLTTASFGISTWFKLSEEAANSSNPVGLFTFVNSNDPENYNPLSLGVVLKTSGSRSDFFDNNIPNTDIVVYNNGPHDAGNFVKNVYAFYNNDISAGPGNNWDHPTDEIKLDDKWHHLFLQYQKPQNFSSNYAINQFQTGVTIFPFGDETYGYPKTDFYGYSVAADAEYSIDTIKNILLTQSGNNSIIANVNIFGSLTDISDGTTDEYYGISVYNLKDDKYTLLQNKIVESLSSSYRTTIFLSGLPVRTFFDVKPLGTYNSSSVFLVCYNYLSTNPPSDSTIKNNVEYFFCKFDTELSCSTPKLLSQKSSNVADFITQFDTLPLEYSSNKCNRIAISTNYWLASGINKHSSSLDVYQIDYANETLVSGVVVNQYTGSNSYNFTNNLQTISSSNGYPSNSFIQSFSIYTASSGLDNNHFTIYVSNSGGTYDSYSLGSASNPGAGISHHIYLKYITGNLTNDYYVMNRVFSSAPSSPVNYQYSGTLHLFNVNNAAKTFTTSSELTYSFNNSRFFNNPDDIFIAKNLNTFIMPTGRLTSSISVFSFNTSSMSITNLQNKEFVEDPIITDEDPKKLKDSYFIETLQKPFIFNNRFSSSFNVPFAYFDSGSLIKYLTTIKLDINTGSNATIKLFLDGKQKYGGVCYENGISGTSKNVILTNQPYYETGYSNHSNNNLNRLLIGFSTASQAYTNSLGFKGEIDELSLWYGSYTTSAVEAIYNSGVINNINTLASQFYQNPTKYFVPTSSDKIQTNVSGNLFGWYRLGYYDLSEKNVQDVYRYNDDFFEKIGEMDLLARYKENNDFKTHYEKILSENTTSIQKISLTVNGISKLLPYNGFYPSQRTAQIGKLFLDSVGNFDQFKNSKQPIFLSDLDDPKKNGGDYKINNESVVQAFLQPFMAPGILFNSIKSGISVDWPLYIDNQVSTTGSVSSTRPIFYKSSSLGIDVNRDGVEFIMDSTTASIKRVPFEALLNLNSFPKKDNSTNTDIIYYQNPTIYSLKTFFDVPIYNNDSGFVMKNVYPYFIWNGTKNDSLYELAINNFVAETPRFFLQNRGLTTFKSAPSREIYPTVSGTLYIMDINLYKDELFDMIIPAFTNSVGKYFGPPTNITSSLFNSASLIDPAYAPYTPPYLYGKTTLRLKYLADKDNATITDIISNLQTEDINTDLDNRFNSLSGSLTSSAYQNRMKLNSCIVFNGTLIDPTVTIKEGDSSREISDNISQIEQNKRWVISTKWETPAFNFQDRNSLNAPLITDSSFTGTIYGTYNPSIAQTGPVEIKPVAGTGIWSGYSTNTESGIKLSISTPLLQTGTSSLADLCKFESVEKKIGQVADKKIITEAIAIIPYYENTDQNNTTDKFKFIKLDKNVFKSSYDYLRSNNFNQKMPNSIVDMIKNMENYEIPLHLDFLSKAKSNNFSDYDPFAMYIFEFSRDLDKQDLADIWQGVLPKAGLVAQKDSITIEHEMGPEQLINNIEDPKNLKWLIFKVKRKAEKFYDSLTDFTDDRFKLLKIETQNQNIGYNWPYDYFSLVELANVEVKFSMVSDLLNNKKEKTIEITTAPGSVKQVEQPSSTKKVSKG